MNAVATKKSFERAEPRTQVLPIEIKGLLTVVDRNLQVPFLVWDVSECGVGVWTSQTLSEGTSVVVTIGHPYLAVVECRVVWCQEEESQHGYRMGLEVVERRRGFRQLVDNVLEESEAFGRPV